MIVPLSQYTVQTMLDKFYWGNLTQAQKISILNAAQEDIAILINSYTNRTDYMYDTIGSAEEVLSPGVGSYDSLYTAYLKIKFSAYDGQDTVINDIDLTKKLISIDEGNIVINTSDTSTVVYTIPILGATLDYTFKVTPPRPGFISIDIVLGNLIITAAKNHVAFDIEIEKKKES